MQRKLVTANEQKARALAILLNVLLESITRIGFTGPPRLESISWKYVEGLATVWTPGGRLLLMCFSDEEPGTQGPRRVSRQEIEDAFSQGWSIESIEPSGFEVRPDLKDLTCSEEGPRAWFVVVRRGG